MDLGLSNLTDDQLVDLLQEACAELAQRDPIVRKEAQARISEEGRKIKLLREAKAELLQNEKARGQMLEQAVREAVLSCRSRQIEEIRIEVFKVLREEMKDGIWRPLNSTDEAQAVVDGVKGFDLSARESRRGYSPGLAAMMNPYPPQQGVPPSDKETPYSADRTVVDRFDRKF